MEPYQVWHSSQVDVPYEPNFVGFQNDRADALTEDLRGTFDRGRRKKLAREFHKLLHEQQPYTFMYAPKDVYAWRSELKGVEFAPVRPQTSSLRWYFQ